MSDSEERLTEAGGATAHAHKAPVRSKRRTQKRRASADRHSRDGRDDENVNDDVRYSDNSDLSDDDRVRMFEESLVQSVLPDIPPIKGFHVCWLTESNQRDSIARRERMGYSPVLRSELRGWHGGNMKTAEVTDDYVRINEMIAYKIPLGLYNRFMRLVHHDMPLQEEGKLRAKLDELKQASESAGARLEEGDGMAELGKRVRPMPEFRA